MRAGLVNVPEDYAWSSALAHCREDDLEQRLDLTEWRDRYDGERWQTPLRVGVEQEAWDERIPQANGADCRWAASNSSNT